MQDNDFITDDTQSSNSGLAKTDDSSELAAKSEKDLSKDPATLKTKEKLYGFASFSGPLPPPEILKAYDIIEPGLARDIFNLAQKQAEHRMELEKAVIYGDGRRSWTGLVLGFVIACFFLASSAYIIVNGHDVAGGLLAGGGLASLVSVFVYGTNKRAQERSEKRKALLEADSIED